MARFILDVKVNSAEEFGEVLQEMKTLFPTRTATAALIDGSNTNQFNEDRQLNFLTEEQIDNYRRICNLSE